MQGTALGVYQRQLEVAQADLLQAGGDVESRYCVGDIFCQDLGALASDYFVSAISDSSFSSHSLVEKPNDLASNVLPSRLLVIHNTSTCRQDNVSELTRRQQLDNPLLEISESDIVARGDDASFVETTIELNDNFAAAVIVDLFEFTDVAYSRTNVSIASKIV
jgi:hypothetical protein